MDIGNLESKIWHLNDSFDSDRCDRYVINQKVFPFSLESVKKAYTAVSVASTKPSKLHFKSSSLWFLWRAVILTLRKINSVIPWDNWMHWSAQLSVLYWRFIFHSCPWCSKVRPFLIPDTQLQAQENTALPMQFLK